MDYKKIILIVVFMTMAFMISSFQVNALDTCYQEQANVSTACGGLDTGSYSHSEEWDDGDWGTGKDWGGSDFDRYVNYTIPSITLKNVTIKTRIEVDLSHTRYDAYTPVPSSCMSGSTLQFKISSRFVYKASRNLYLYCYDGSGWTEIYHKGWDDLISGWFYEEGVYWVFNYPPSVSDVHIEPNPAWDFETLRGYCNASSDTDATINISYAWYGYTGNVLLKNGTTTINNEEETLISTLTADERSSYEYSEIYLTCTPTDTNGEGSTTNSNTITLLGSSSPTVSAYMIPNGTEVLTTNTIKQYCYVDSASNYSINYTIYKNNISYINGIIENISSDEHETNVYNLTTADYDNLDTLILNCNVTNYAGTTIANSSETTVVESIINFTTLEYGTNNELNNVSYFLYNITGTENTNGSHYYDFNNEFVDEWGSATTSGTITYSSEYPFFNSVGDGRTASFAINPTYDAAQLMTDAEADSMGSTYTYSLWFRSTNESSYDNWLLQRSRYFDIQITQDSHYPQDIMFYNYNFGQKTIQDVIEDDRWYNLVFTQNNTAGGETKVYLNGVLIDTYTQTAAVSYDTEVYLGNKDNKVYNFRGGIDEVKTWNKILTSDEIKNIYEYGSADPKIEITNLSANNNYLSAGEHTILAQKEGYLDLFSTITITEGETSLKTLSGMGNSRITISAKDEYTGEQICTFEGWVYNSYYGTNTSFSTTTCSSSVEVLGNETYKVFIDSPNYASKETTVETNQTLNNEEFELYKARSLHVVFKDLDTGTIVQPDNITIELINNESYVLSTITGEIYKENLADGSYIARYYASGYDETTQFFDIDEDTGHSFTWYLAGSNDTTQVEITILDETARPVEGAIVKALRYNINTNNYELQTSGQTNTEGKTYLRLTYNDEFYKFMVVYDGELKKVTTPSYITSTSIIIQINLGDEVLKEYYEYLSIDASLTFNTANDEFRLTYNDEDNIGSNYCLKIYKLENNETTLINSECLTTSAGSIIIGVTPENGTTYLGKAFYDDNYLTQTSYTYPEDEPIGKKGLYIQALLMIGLTVLLIAQPEFIPLGLSSSLLFGRLMGLIQLSYQSIIGLMVVGIVITFVMKRRY